jgi:nitroreductase
MEAIAQMLAHRSIRSYRPDPVPEDLLQEILHAATRASTSGNMQTYSVIVTRDEARRRELYDIHYEQEMVLQAPLLLTFVADWRRMNRWCRLSEAEPGYDNLLSFLVAFADALIAAQNAALAAEARGLGICYMGTTICRTEELIDFFDLPTGVFPATTLVLGYPDEQPELRARLPMTGIVHEERYRDPDDDGIREIYRERETEGWKRYEAMAELAERMRESGVKNLAQVYTTLKYTKAGNEAISTEIMAMLKRQGFLG